MGLKSFPALTSRDLSALIEFSKAEDRFEPLGLRRRQGKTITAKLVALGLLEEGPSEPKYQSHKYTAIGYRLTELGWSMLKRSSCIIMFLLF